MDRMEPLVDGSGRKITYLRVSITDRCNLRCIYCMPEKGIDSLTHDEIMSYENILKFVNVLANHGVCKVRITGGEPLVRKGVTEFIGHLSEIPGIHDISMTTNAILLGKFAQTLYNAGLKRINISIDTLREDRFNQITRFGGLRSVLNGLKLAKEIGYDPIKINTVLIKGVNDDEIIDFVNFAREFNLNLRFIEYMPIGGNITEAVTSKEIEKIIKSVFADFNPLHHRVMGDEVSREYGFTDSKATIGFISPLSEHFCGSCNRLRLTPSGRLRPCLFYDNEYNIKELLKEKNDEVIFRYVSDLIQLKKNKHNFGEKIKNPGSLMGANDFMNGIGG